MMMVRSQYSNEGGVVDKLDKVSEVEHDNNICITQNCLGVDLCVRGEYDDGPGH